LIRSPRRPRKTKKVTAKRILHHSLLDRRGKPVKAFALMQFSA